MSYEGLGLDLGILLASVDMTTTGRFLFGNIDANGGVSVSTTAATVNDGIIQTNPPAGTPVSLRFVGISKVIAGAAFAKGALLANDAQGRAVTAASGQKARARALEAATAAGAIVACLLTHAVAP